MLNGQIDWSDPADMVHELAYLRQRLRGRYRHVDEHLLDGSIEDAILDHHAHPERFDAERGISLLSYLAMLTRSHLYRRLRTERRHRHHERAVGVWGENFEKIVSEMGAERSIYLQRDSEELENQREALDAILARLPPRDRAGVRLLHAGASHKKWVRHLRIEHLPREEQQYKVNKEKERLKKKLKRWARRMQGGGKLRVGVRVLGDSFDAGGERESWRTQPRMSYNQQVDGSSAGKHSSASHSLFSVCCWS